MIPATALLTQSDVARNHPALQPALHALGTPSEQTRVIGSLLALVGVYLIKGILTQKIAHDYNPPLWQRGGEGVFMMHGWPPWAMTILTVLAWRQTRFAFDVQAQLSQRLFTVYLHQPYTCRFFRVFRGYPGLPASPPPTESLPRTRSGGEGAGGGDFRRN